MGSKLWYIIFIFLVAELEAQVIVKGTVYDALTHEPLMFANVYAVDAQVGAMSGSSGDFQIVIKNLIDTLFVSFVGYKSLKVPVVTEKSMRVLLQPELTALDEIIVRQQDDPAYAILDSFYRKSAGVKLSDQKFVQYTRAMNAGIYFRKFFYDDNENFSIRPLLKSFEAHAVDIGDSSVPAVPGYYVENVTECYVRNKPVAQKYVMNYYDVKGAAFDNTNFMNELLQEHSFIDLFNDKIILINKPFISPVTKFGRMFYRYYLVDTVKIDDKQAFQIEFYPKHKDNLAFSGVMWIEDSVFHIRRISLGTTTETGINFVQRIKIQQEITYSGGMLWPENIRVSVDAVNLFIKMNIINSDLKTGISHPLAFYDSGISKSGIRSNKFEEGKEKIQNLSLHDTAMVRQVELVSTDKMLKSIALLTEMSITGFLRSGFLEFGPYLNLYSWNKTEGNRFQVGFRTNNKLISFGTFNGYIAYGTFDNEFKYQVATEIVLQRRYWITTGCEYLVDNITAGEELFNFAENRFYSYFNRWGGSEYTFRKDAVSWWIGMDLSNWVTSKLTISYSEFDGTDELNIFRWNLNHENGMFPSDFTSMRGRFDIRLHPGQVYTQDGNRRYLLDHKGLPVLDIGYEKSYIINGATNTNSHRFDIILRDQIKLPVFGEVVYRCSAKKIFDPVPLPMLLSPAGNESVFRSDLTYNMMQLGEFFADELYEGFISWHLDGLLLGRIPGIENFDLRLVTDFRIAVGRITQAENLFYDPETNPNGLTIAPSGMGLKFPDFDEPYLEHSIGVENILKFLRVDFINRLSFRDNNDNFGIKVSGVFRF